MEHFMKKFLSLILVTPLTLLAHGENFEAVSGNATHEIVGKTQTITADDKAIIHFTKFNLAPDEHTRFIQEKSNHSILCRVTGKEASKIRGRLDSNSRLLLINPYGIVFGETSQVHVGTLMASTLNIKDEDFLAGNYKFTLDANGRDKAIVNKGKIHADQAVVFMAPQVFNQGVITASTGKVEFLGGEVITLSFDDDQLISFAIEAPLKKGVIEQDGQIIASEVNLDLRTARELIKDVVNVNGLVEASQIKRENGTVYLTAKSSIESNTAEINGANVKSEGHLSVKDSLSMTADEMIHWTRPNKVGDLFLKGNNVVVMGEIDCAKFDLQGTNLFQIGASIFARNSKLIFDAPVSIISSDLTLSPGDLGGDIVFHRSLNADPRFGQVQLKLDAVNGDVAFLGPVGDLRPLDSITILSAHNVTTGSMIVGQFTQKQGTGTTAINAPIAAARGVDINTETLHIHKPVTCEKGDFIAQVNRAMAINQEGVIVARSVLQKGPGIATLAQDMTATEGGIAFEGPVAILAKVNLVGKTEVKFQSTLDGSGDLKIESPTCQFLSDIGSRNPLGILDVNCSGLITVHNIGNGHAGVYGALKFETPGVIAFLGTVYNAGPQVYNAQKNFEFLSSKPTTLTSNQSITFNGASLFLSSGNDLSITTGTGAATIPHVKGSNCNFSLSSRKSAVTVGKVEGVDHFIADGKTIILTGPIQANDTAFYGPVVLKSPEEVFTILAKEGNIHLKSTIKGNTSLSLQAPKGKIILDGHLGGLAKGEDRFKTINLNGKVIDQNSSVNSTGPIVYAAERIYLGGDVNTNNNDITFNGPVTIDHSDAITITNTGYRNGNILFESTLDADRPSRALIVHNARTNGLVFFKGDVGTSTPLGDLKVVASKIAFKNIGTSKTYGVAKHLDVKATQSIDLSGLYYSAGQETWVSPTINLENEGHVTFTSNGLPLIFANSQQDRIQTHLKLKASSSVAFQTQGGLLEFTHIEGDRLQPITINTGRGRATFGTIEGSLGHLQAKGQEILLGGKIEVGSAFIEAEREIQYKLPEGNTPFFKTSIITKGPLTINAKEGFVGKAENPIRVETKGRLEAGAQSFAYLEGTTDDGECHFYVPNPPPRLFFNGNEYRTIPMQEFAEEDELMSLAPDLSHKIPRGFIDGSTLKPRRAPIYYETR